ncbi:MAG: EI24 domain-containing protein [Betaproteobacteria bacterium]|nr:EI24 domain-containing protein [Betaproteobacteria bacterium]
MSEITKALIRAFASLLHPRMLLLMLWPVAIALVLWLGLAFTFWSQAAAWLQLQFDQSAAIGWAITVWPLSLVATHLAWILLALLFLPLVLITAVLIIGVFAMPAMVKHVAGRTYPGLALRRGGTFAGSVWNSVAALAWLALLALLSLPLWFFPPLWPLLPIVLFGYLNQRVFRYDALAEHASSWEMETLIRRHRRELFVLGAVLALVGLIPVLGFFAPVYAGLAFIHYCLARLAQLRDEPVATQ